ncbi:MAG: thioredoxin domain-containing protein [Propionibacteriaceae bacterium]|jgi:protein-disulfide isomerase|nr:thioredoxin domain-containing protein [Propionibacteriaceae bacterium]
MSRRRRPGAKTTRQIRVERVRQRRRRTWAGLGLTAAAIGLAVLVYQVLAALPTDFSRPPHASPDGLGIYLNQVSQPKHELVIYSDYTCVGCAEPMVEFYEAVTADAASVGVRVESRDINGPSGDPAAQALARRAAMAAACADSTMDYGFFQMTAYYHQRDLTIQSLSNLVNLFGVDQSVATAYRECYASEANAAFVDGVDQAARQSGFQIVDWPIVLLDGQDVTDQMRTPEGDTSGSFDADAARALIGLAPQQ